MQSGKVESRSDHFRPVPSLSQRSRTRCSDCRSSGSSLLMGIHWNSRGTFYVATTCSALILCLRRGVHSRRKLVFYVLGLCRNPGSLNRPTLREPASYQVIYPSGVQEEELRRYFLGEGSVSELAQDLRGSVLRVDDLGSAVRITDMQSSFSLTRLHLVMICDAFLNKR
jgi:hypothetical protein